MIKFFTKENCQQCNATKRTLAKKNVEYQEIDVEKDSSALEFLNTLGVKSLPVIYMSSEKFWTGFRPDMLSQI